MKPNDNKFSFSLTNISNKTIKGRSVNAEKQPDGSEEFTIEPNSEPIKFATEDDFMELEFYIVPDAKRDLFFRSNGNFNVLKKKGKGQIAEKVIFYIKHSGASFPETDVEAGVKE